MNMLCLSPHSPLKDHDVAEDKIFLLSLLMAEMGVHSVAYAFPKVRIITTAVDKEVNDQFHIIPGIGEELSFQSTALNISCREEKSQTFIGRWWKTRICELGASNGKSTLNQTGKNDRKLQNLKMS